MYAVGTNLKWVGGVIVAVGVMIFVSTGAVSVAEQPMGDAFSGASLAARSAITSVAWGGLGGPTGGCCLPEGNCKELTGEDCLGAGGEYQGDGTPCVQAVVNDFEGGINTTGWTFGVTVPDILEPAGGSPGWWLHNDGIVAPADLAQLLGTWGPCA